MVTYQCALKIHIGENNVPAYSRKNEKEIMRTFVLHDIKIMLKFKKICILKYAFPIFVFVLKQIILAYVTQCFLEIILF